MSKFFNVLFSKDGVFSIFVILILTPCIYIVYTLDEGTTAALAISRDIIYVTIAIIVLRLYFYLMNRAIGFETKIWISKSDSLSVAILLGSMFIGTSMLMASILG